MRYWIVALMLVIGGLLGACSDGKAESLFETAKLEELQNNPDHARQLYGEILAKYPQSDVAPLARERLDALTHKP